MRAWLALAAPLLAALCCWAGAYAAAGPGVGRVVAAFLRRNLLAMASYRFRTAMLLVNGALAVLLLALAARGFLAPALRGVLAGPAGSAIRFVVTGAALWPAIWAGYAASSSTLRQEQMLGTMEVVAATPCGVEAVPVAALAGSGGGALLVAAGTLGVAFVAFPMGGLDAWGIPVAAAALVLAMLFLWGVGLAVGALTVNVKQLGGFDASLRLMLLLVSGVYFPPGLLPGWLEAVGHALPLALGLQVAREALDGTARALPTVVARGILAGAALLGAAVGARLLRTGLRAARRSGRLQGY
ncbi:MAG: type transport system permease protein [Thermoplasmata archaeon]|jgi:ABC-2 type transport system permease protein|nr:type transport system permease protein [Thermoplasmata archaeon]